MRRITLLAILVVSGMVALVAGPAASGAIVAASPRQAPATWADGGGSSQPNVLCPGGVPTGC